MKKLISLFMAVVMLFGIGAEPFAAYEGDKVHAYESADCTIVYNITNEWSGNQQVSVSITNNSEETLRNWAIKFDNTGNISNIWNASVLENNGELCVIRNNGYNYEIVPNATVEFGFMQQGDNLSLPENISLCSKTADSTASAEISYEIQNNWDEGFVAAVTIKNVSDEPLEAWKLHFNGNFEISSIWNANLLYTEDDSFRVENDVTTTPIAVGETKTFSFEGAIASGEEPVMSDFTLTSIVIDVNADSDDSGETEESGETNESNETDESGESGETQEPTDPDEPIETEKPVILCFGEYLADENALEVYWYSTAQGAVSVYENTNDNGWVKLADVTDEDSYKHEITEDFLVKYIKVKQETESGTIESEPFIVAYTEDGYACTWLDTDEDGLPDYAEKIYGTDPENPDTDSDGLSDYDELYTVGTSPLKYDTDEDGTNDADSDLDSDGLTNAQELELGTSPSTADTDGDTLSDYAELYETDTDPLKADTDGDTLSDSDDIALGLDPNDPETFGVPDAEYKVEQTISADSEVMERVNTDEAPYELSLEITASGNAATNLIAGSSIYSTITESDARLGGTVDLSYLSGDVEKVKLIYEVGEDYIPNDGSEYAANCVDLQGIKRYNIFRYFEEVNMLLPVATEFDVENNTLYAETDELGTYCVLDMEMLLRNLGIEPDGTQEESVSHELFSSAESGYCITFVIDIRKNVMTEEKLENIKEQLCKFANTLFSEGKEAYIILMTQDATDFSLSSSNYIGLYSDYDKFVMELDNVKLSQRECSFGDYCVITDGLKMAVDNAYAGIKNYTFCIYEQQDVVFDRDAVNAISEKAAENGVNISVITSEYPLTGYQTEITEQTGGTEINTYYCASSIYNHIFEEQYAEKEALPVILATGYQKVVLDSKLYPNGYWGDASKDADTDKDDLTDWDEVKTELLTINGYGDYELPAVRECLGKLGDVPFYVEGALSESDIRSQYWNAEILPINSDPTNVDGDFDGIDDIDDDMRLNNHFTGTLIDTNEAAFKESKGTVSISDAKYYSIEYSMDYSVFFKDNSTYSSSLCTISSLYATTAYMNMSIDDEFYAYNHPDSYYAAALMEKHGMSNIEVVEIVGDGTDQHVTDIIIGSRQISKNGQCKTVILVAIRGTGNSALREGSNVMEWSSNFDIGCDSIYANDGNSIIPKNPDWIIEENHMGFDITATRVIAAINQYVNTYGIDTDNSVLWFTGHSRGAGISNIVGARVGSKAIESKNDYNNEYICESYVYTFASPRTTVVDASIAKSYDYIFNIVNEDDIVTELPFKQWGFIRYGEDISISILNKYKSQWNSLANEQVKYNTDIEWRKNLVDEMALLSNNERNGCYKYTCECEHGDKTDDSITMGLGLFKDEIAYAKPYRTVTEGEHVCETVAYFMQFLSYLAANGGDNITIIFTDVSPKYESVKSSFIRYCICQNMETPHHQLSYFLLSRCL